jgi:hypothetical protein
MPMMLPLDEMTTQEKLAAMELLWDDLSRSADGVGSPSWHEDVLAERKDSAVAGGATFVDWETAKAELRTKLK